MEKVFDKSKFQDYAKKGMAGLEGKIASDIAYVEAFGKAYQSFLATPGNQDVLAHYYHQDFGFGDFAKEFSVSRNIKAGHENKLLFLSILFDGISKNRDIDSVALQMKNEKISALSIERVPILPLSLVSKCYMLHKPYEYYPYDSLAGKAIRYTIGKFENYAMYQKACGEFYQHYKQEIDKLIETETPQMQTHDAIVSWKEKHGEEKLQDLLRCRLTDKILWVIGSHHSK